MRLNKYLGYNTSRLGLHWTPISGHAHSDLTYFIDRTAQMGINWVLLLDDGGGSTLEANKFYGNSIHLYKEWPEEDDDSRTADDNN